MKYKDIIFDLDGTLIDSALGIEESFLYSFSKIYEKKCTKNIKSIIGPPIDEMLFKVNGETNPENLGKFVKEFKLKYDLEGYKKSELFPNTIEVLSELKERGLNLFIATNKRELPTDLILKYLGINQFFKSVYCLDSFEEKIANKTELVRKLLITYSLGHSETLLVGDTSNDGLAAEQNEINFALAQYGYGDYVNSTYKLNNIQNLVKII